MAWVFVNSAKRQKPGQAVKTHLAGREFKGGQGNCE
jgi:hypothetical protein